MIDDDLPPPHPGEILREDVLPHLALSRAELARHLGLPQRRLADLLAERIPVTLELAQRLGAGIGWGARYWLGLQAQYDIWHAARRSPIEASIKPLQWRRASNRAEPVTRRDAA